MPKFISRGTKFELTFIECLNNKKYCELSNNMKNVVTRLFDNIKDDDLFIAEHADPRGKPDVIITRNNESHYLSLKTGNAEGVHAENIAKFVNFLSENGVSEETIETILQFQYGDGTDNGTGTERHGYDELMYKMKNEIEKANKELNANSKLLIDSFARFVFEGNFIDLPNAEYIYHGNEKFGVICSREQIEKHLRRRKYTYLTTLHIGPILLRPYARFIDFSDPAPEKRHIVCFRWVGMNGDLDYISERYDG